MKAKAGTFFGILLVAIAPRVHADEADKKLAAQAFAVLKQHCATCHHGPKPTSDVQDFEVLDRASLIKKRVEGNYKTYYLVFPKNLDKSYLWQRVGVEGSMPPMDRKDRPTAADKDVLKKWIEAGAPDFPKAESKRDVRH